jgi:hypothetical protein
MEEKEPTILWVYTNSLGHLFAFEKRQSDRGLHGETKFIDFESYTRLYAQWTKAVEQRDLASMRMD